MRRSAFGWSSSRRASWRAPSSRASSVSPLGGGTPQAKIDGTLTERDRGSKALFSLWRHSEGAPSRALLSRAGSWTAPSGAGNPQQARPLAPSEDRRESPLGRVRKPLAPLLLGDRDHGLAARSAQVPRFPQLPREHERAGRGRRFPDDQIALAGRSGFGGEETRFEAETVAAEPQGRRVPAGEGEGEEIAILGDDAGAGISRPDRERDRAVSAAIRENAPWRRSRERLEQERERRPMVRVLVRVLRPLQAELPSWQRLDPDLVARGRLFRLVGASPPRRKRIDRVTPAGRYLSQSVEAEKTRLRLDDFAEIADDHHPQLSGRGEPSRPGGEEMADGTLPDPRGDVANDPVEALVRGEVAVPQPRPSLDVCETEPRSVVGARAHRQHIAIDEQSAGVREPGRDRKAERAVAAAEIEEGSARSGRQVSQEEERSVVDGVGGEDVERHVERKGEPSRALCQSSTGIRTERGDGFRPRSLGRAGISSPPAGGRAPSPAARRDHARPRSAARAARANASFTSCGAVPAKSGRSRTRWTASTARGPNWSDRTVPAPRRAFRRRTMRARDASI